MNTNRPKAVVLLSGGLDSATVAAIAKSQNYDLFALSINYQQRHVTEILFAKKIASQLGITEHKILNVDLGQFGGSALTDHEIAIPRASAQQVQTDPAFSIPITYVPARNTIMLSLALSFAEVINANDIFFGANAVDYSGYPDCRPEYIKAFEKMANLATRRSIEGHYLSIRTPIINDSKADIIQKGIALGLNYAETVSCYQATSLGEACGNCDSCVIRRKGFQDAGIADPTIYVYPPKD